MRPVYFRFLIASLILTACGNPGTQTPDTAIKKDSVPPASAVVATLPN
jgi:hypothetical protein